ncbi:N-succinylarginine dihydrolase [Saccharospirillum sp. MSK14-1]|uniref:N-succinylarginine dihydrolase n=1 Tax=Saccharospirillum sp. MSK14-1 TaxID=1897632 RepID=UPI000D383C23|nr:N-succinylarginine dihydrolase [Saccharospirillum sp. MSK14-1]PTY38137.1 N-succinylarginine dihydrolase [Saccharospirillum sp. MSK14-1]
MTAFEMNLDGLVGPTHNYAGLSYGNIASLSNEQSASNPKEAAKQGLRKMKALADRGLRQGILLPHERPAIWALRNLGFSGSDAQVLAKVAQQNPEILSAVSSASCMWTANAATVSPSADTADGKVHFTAANLNAKFHRSIEHPTTTAMLQSIFADERHFAHHEALPAVSFFGDEGAANHTRFCGAYDAPGVELFVYGQAAFDHTAPKPVKFPARQTLEASQAIARLHGLSDRHSVFALQKPETIDAGVFHNDVIAVGNRNVLFYHDQAFANTQAVLDELQSKLGDVELIAICVSSDEVSLQDAVRSYLFNSQLLSVDDDTMVLVVPGECREIPAVSDYLDALVADANNPIDAVEVFDLKQSMQNGGGPACLRLRVALNESEYHAMNSGVILTDQLFNDLNTWVDRHYRDRLTQADLADPQLLLESRTALDELTQLTGLGSLYPFQR